MRETHLCCGATCWILVLMFVFISISLYFYQVYWISVPTTTLDCPAIRRLCRQELKLWSLTALDWVLSGLSVGRRYDSWSAPHLSDVWFRKFIALTICDLKDLHKHLEQKLAEFHEREDCILYASCFDANAGLFEVSQSETWSPTRIRRMLFGAVFLSGIWNRCCWAQRTQCCQMSSTTPPSLMGSACVEPRGCATNTWIWKTWKANCKSLRFVDFSSH